MSDDEKQDDYEVHHIRHDPPTYAADDPDISSRAVYTCEDCGAKHKGFDPATCEHCGCDSLDWGFSYGFRRFA